jgi:ActR/RegA family two-component response regulator
MENMDKRVLILDDNEERMKRFKRYFLEMDDKKPYVDYVYTAQECIEKLKQHDYYLACFDHDLGDRVNVPTNDPNTGSEVVRWMWENKPNIEHVIVHSCNEYASKGMVIDLQRMDYDAIWIPYTILYKHYYFNMVLSMG